MREGVERQLAHTPASKRAETERTLVRAALEQNSRRVREQAGVGEGALPCHKEAAELSAQHRALSQRFNRISDELAEVACFDVKLDPKSGERVTLPVYAVENIARQKLVQEQGQLSYQMGLLEGVQGERLMKKALRESVELVKKRNEMIAEETLIQAGAEKLNREQRLQKRIEARARMIADD